MVELRQREALAARCFEFVILTAARSGEALGAQWGEIDLDGKLWTVPASRMKAGAQHVVPLSNAAIDVLHRVRLEKATAEALVFAVGGAARSNMAMAMLLRRMGRSDLSPSTASGQDFVIGPATKPSTRARLLSRRWPIRSRTRLRPRTGTAPPLTAAVC